MGETIGPSADIPNSIELPSPFRSQRLRQLQHAVDQKALAVDARQRGMVRMSTQQEVTSTGEKVALKTVFSQGLPETMEWMVGTLYREVTAGANEALIGEADRIVGFDSKAGHDALVDEVGENTIRKLLKTPFE